MNTIRTYKNNIFIEFSESGENFTLNVPHYKEWISLIFFLRKRGFKIGENKLFKKYYKSISKYHKIGFKNDVVVLLEITSNSIKLEFGNQKNLWGDGQGFVVDFNENYINLTYVEKKKIELEFKKVLNYYINKNIVYLPNDNDRTDIENIIHSDNNNLHIHGKISILEDIGKYIKEDSYDYKFNSFDKNKKRIICGDIKYFYDYYTRRLSVGVVYHNINNMWWVLVNGKRYNYASFNLFDYEPELPKREPVTKHKIVSLLKKYSKEMNYERCISIRNYAYKKGINLLNQ